MKIGWLPGGEEAPPGYGVGGAYENYRHHYGG